jgi:hypothetical protein
VVGGGQGDVLFWDRRTQRPLDKFDDMHMDDVTQVSEEGGRGRGVGWGGGGRSGKGGVGVGGRCHRLGGAAL